MNREMSFGQRVDAGWQRVELQDYYSMTEREFDKVMDSLQQIRKNGAKK